MEQIPQKLSSRRWRRFKANKRGYYSLILFSLCFLLSLGAEIALCHHEKYDGSGYPHGTKGESIPLEARIVAVADVFDALTSERPYKAKWSNDKAVDYLIADSGKHFDPICVQAFTTRFSQIELVQQQLQDTTQTQLGLPTP